jgi:chromosome segregation ATPase
MNQAEVQRNIDDITSKLQTTEQELDSDQSRFQQDTNELQQKAQKLRALLKDAESKLETEKRKSKQVREDLDMRLIFEVVKARNLSEKLKSQQDTFRQEIEELEQASADTRAKLADAKGQLESARASFLEDKETLQYQIADGERIRTLKVKQMAQRYSNIREDLTEKWQDERRKARSERIRLDEKYKTKLSGLRESIPLLERELAKTRKMTEDLYVRKANTAMEKAAILKDIGRREMSYIQKKSELNVAISALEMEIDSLTQELSKRDEKLTKYKSSLRSILSLSIKLTGKRIRGVGRRLLGPFRRKPNTRSSQELLTTVRRSAVNGKNKQ